MTWPRLAGHQFRLTPEHQGDPWVWRHTTLVTRPPHRRLNRMRRHLLGPIGPPPYRVWRTYLDPTNENAIQAAVDAYAAVVRPTKSSVLATLRDADGEPDPHGAYLTLELQP